MPMFDSKALKKKEFGTQNRLFDTKSVTFSHSLSIPSDTWYGKTEHCKVNN